MGMTTTTARVEQRSRELQSCTSVASDDDASPAARIKNHASNMHDNSARRFYLTPCAIINPRAYSVSSQPRYKVQKQTVLRENRHINSCLRSSLAGDSTCWVQLDCMTSWTAQSYSGFPIKRCMVTNLVIPNSPTKTCIVTFARIIGTKKTPRAASSDPSMSLASHRGGGVWHEALFFCLCRCDFSWHRYPKQPLRSPMHSSATRTNSL